MPFHMLKKTVVSGAVLLTAACGLFSEEKIPLEGQRISVLEGSGVLQPDFKPGEIKITVPAPVMNSSWSQNGGNSRHLMQNPYSDNKLKEEWSSSFGSGDSKRDFLIAAPVAAYKVVFAIDADGIVSAFRMDSGKRIWKKRLKPLIKDDQSTSMKGAGLAVMDKKVFATTGFGGVFALDMVTGKQLWRYDTGMPIRIAPTAGHGVLFAQTIDNHLYAFNSADGSVLWDYKSVSENTTLVGGASPAYSPSQDVVIAAFSSGEIRAFKASTGSPLWGDVLVARRRTNSLSNINAIKANPVIDGDVVYAAGSSNIMVAIDLRTGARIWEKEIGSTNMPWVAGKYLFVLSNNFDLLAMEAKSGKIIWNIKVPAGQDAEEKIGVSLNGPVLTNNRLLVATSSGYAFAISPYTGKILGFVTLDDGVEISPIVAGGYAFLTTKDADLVAYK